MIRTELTETVAEESTSQLTGQIVGLDGVGFLPEQVWLTLYDQLTRKIINERQLVDVTGSVSAQGFLTFEFKAADNVIVGSRKFERHIALLEWDWDAGQRRGKHEVSFTVRNLAHVPPAQ